MAAAQGSLKIDLVALNKQRTKPLLSLLPLLLQISNFLLVFILFFALEWLLMFYHLYRVGACGKPVCTEEWLSLKFVYDRVRFCIFFKLTMKCIYFSSNCV